MARIRMMETITGGRYDGRAWPVMNDPFHVPDWEAAELVAAKHAIYDEDPDLVLDAPAAVPPSLSDDVAGSDGASQDGPDLTGPKPGEPDDEPDDVADEDDDAAMRPAVNHPKSAWVEYAVSQGADRAEAEGKTKADLISEHGARL